MEPYGCAHRCFIVVAIAATRVTHAGSQTQGQQAGKPDKLHGNSVTLAHDTPCQWHVDGSRDMVGSPSHRARRHTAPVGLHTTRTQLLQKENPTRRLCPHDNDYGDDETVTTASCRPVIHAEAGRRVNGQCPHQHLHRHRGPHRRLGRCRCSPPGITHTAKHTLTYTQHTHTHPCIHTYVDAPTYRHIDTHMRIQARRQPQARSHKRTGTHTTARSHSTAPHAPHRHNNQSDAIQTGPRPRHDDSGPRTICQI